MPPRPDEPNQNITMSYMNNKVVKSPVARKLAVQGLSKAMLIQQKAMEQLANIREEAQDLCHEAAAKNSRPEQ